MRGTHAAVVKGLICLALGILGILVAGYGSFAWSESQEHSHFEPHVLSLALRPEGRVFTLPLNNPDVVPVSMASHMESTDLVAGVVVNGHPRAYPLWVLVGYHVVNDTI